MRNYPIKMRKVRKMAKNSQFGLFFTTKFLHFLWINSQPFYEKKNLKTVSNRKFSWRFFVQIFRIFFRKFLICKYAIFRSKFDRKSSVKSGVFVGWGVIERTAGVLFLYRVLNQGRAFQSPGFQTQFADQHSGFDQSF